MLPNLDPAERSAIWGVSGSGKTVMAKKLASRWSASRLVVIIAPTESGPPSIPDEWPGKRQSGILTVSPGTPEDCARALMSCYLLSTPQRPVTVLCDEAPYYLAQPSPALSKVTYQGRHRGLGMTLLGQRPSAVAAAIRSQATKTVFLRLMDRTDLQIVAKSNRELAAELPHLAVGDWRQWPPAASF